MVAVNAVARFTVQSLWLGSSRICPPAIDFETKRKIIKRDGDKLAFQYFPWNGKLKKEFHQVIERRILPEAVNFLALLGWNDGTERTVYFRRISRSF
jgi:hypothetical protein